MAMAAPGSIYKKRCPGRAQPNIGAYFGRLIQPMRSRAKKSERTL